MAAAKGISVVCIAVLLSLSLAGPAPAEEVSVDLDVESQDVYLGESFIVQIRVNGSDEVESPDLSGVDGFSIESLGGSNNSSQSITIINGKLQRSVQRAYIFNYRFTPRLVGRLTIPSISVVVGGKTFQTDPVTVAVRRPTETEDFKLRMTMSRDVCYPGEPVVLTVTWYLRRDVEDFRFTVPIFGSNAFDFETPQIDIDPEKRYYRISVEGGEIIAEKGRGILDGESYATLTFSRVLVPKRAGSFEIPEAVVECEAITGSRRSRDFFDDFFNDDFFRVRRGRIKKYVVPSNTLALEVRELPLEDRPPGFHGLVGEYRISASAEPVKVNVGDPITLRLTIEGPDYLGGVDLPPLSEQEALLRDFKIPEERADGILDGRRKVFTQTIRALHDGVTEIPTIELVYFDTKTGRYRTTRTDPIPIEVEPTRVVTALDAEGLEPVGAGIPIERWKEGIAFNYEGPEVVAPQSLGLGSLAGRPVWLLLVTAPPAAFAALLALTAAVRRRNADPAARRARGAYSRCLGRLQLLSKKKDLSYGELCAGVMEALREYLGDKLNRPGAALTVADAADMLGSRGIDPVLVGEVEDLFGVCEAGSYAGGYGGAAERDGLVPRVVGMAKKLEGAL